MATHDFTTTLLVDQSPKEVFTRLTMFAVGGRARLKAAQPN